MPSSRFERNQLLMDTYKLKKSTALIKTYVAVSTFGTATTVVALFDGENETDIGTSVGTTEDGVGTFNLHGNIPLLEVGKNNRLADHYLFYYIKVGIGHLPPHLKKRAKQDLIDSGVEIGMQGGKDGNQTFKIVEDDFDKETVKDVLSILKSIQLS